METFMETENLTPVSDHDLNVLMSGSWVPPTPLFSRVNCRCARLMRVVRILICDNHE